MSRPMTVPILERSSALKSYHNNKDKKKQKLIDKTNKAKEKTKREFEAYLNEEMKKYPLGFNPYQE